MCVVFSLERYNNILDLYASEKAANQKIVNNNISTKKKSI